MTQSNFRLLASLWSLVVCFLLAHNGYLWWNHRITPETDILALLPLQKGDAVLRQAFTQMVDKGPQRLVVLVGADEWAQAQDAADAYHLAVASHANLLQLEQRSTADSQHEWVELFKQHRVGLLTAQQESALHQLPAQFWVDRALSKLYRPFGGSTLTAWRDDPFDLFSGWAQARAQETAVRLRDGRLFVSDGRRQYVVLPFIIRVPAFSIAAQQAIVPILEKAKQSAHQVVPTVEVLSAGVILYAAAAAEQATLEVTTIGFGSMLGIIVLTWFAFHSFQPIVLIIVSVAIGCLGALSVCWVIFDRIHLLTLVFGASLIGGAQDYGTYFLCNRLAADVQECDSWQLLRRLMPALVLALLTTVIGYLGLALTPIPGLQQVAIFSAFGLVFAWLTVICWFPILAGPGTLKPGCLTTRYAAMMERWPVLQFNPSTLAVGLLVIAFAAVGLSRLAAHDDLRSLQNPPKQLVDEQIKVSQLLDLPAPAQFYLVRGASVEAVLFREEMLSRRLDRLIEKRLISGYQATSSWVPSFGAQEGRLELIKHRLLNEGGPLSMVAEQIGEDGKWAARLRERLLASALPLTPEQFFAASISAPGRYLWLGNVEGTYGNIVALRGASKNNLPILQDAATGLEGIQFVDKIGEVSSVLGTYRKYMGWVVVLSYFAVYGLLYPRYRRATWRVLAPTSLASIATLALLGTVGAGLQLFHVLALMLLLGIGVDYGIFLQEHSGGRDAVAWLSVALSAMNTLLSFGLLSLSKTPALQAFGLTMLIGTVTVCLAVPCFGVKAAQQNAEFEAKRLG